MCFENTWIQDEGTAGEFAMESGGQTMSPHYVEADRGDRRN
jgi:hypothetical protein